MPDNPVIVAKPNVLEVPPLFGVDRTTSVVEMEKNLKEARTRLAAEAYRETVAFIKTDHGKNRDGSENTTAGTGFFVTKDGVLATDYHVVKDPKAGITVTTSNGVVHTAKLKSIDIKSDLALLQVEPAISGEVFKSATLAESSRELGVSQNVFTRGHPKRSAESKVSTGNQNALVTLNKFTLTDGLIEGEDPDRSMITTVMRADVGNSGGPIVRESDGAVVAILDFNSLSNSLAISTPVEDLHRLLVRSGVTRERIQVAMALPLSPNQAKDSITIFDATRLVVPRADASAQRQVQKDKPAQPSLLQHYADLKTLPRQKIKP